VIRSRDERSLNVTIRLLLVDDQALVREGFRALLAVQQDMLVVGEAENGEQAVAASMRLHPDVVLMDIRMPVMDGLEATRRLTELATDEHRLHVIILTTFDMDEYVYSALRAGASGFLLKDASAQEFLAAIRVVAAGDALLAPSVTRRLIAEFARQAPRERPDSLQLLTERETEVLRLVARGLSNADISAALVVAEQTVKSHVSRILTKLGLRNRAHAVVVAYETGLIVPGDTTA
jgi:DNA-binding NarL/FixJ family response regulator